MSIAPRVTLLSAVVVSLTSFACSDSGGSSDPTVTSFTSSKAAVARGEKVTLSWEVVNAKTVSITATPGGTVLDGSTMLMGSQESGEITERTTFLLTATSEAGKTATAMVEVALEGPRVAIGRFEAAPNPGPLNGISTLSWETVNADEVKIVQGATELYSATVDELDLGTYNVRLTETSQTYTLVASNDSNTVMQSVTIAAVTSPVIISFEVSPVTFVGASASVMVSWMTANAESVKLEANGAAAMGFPEDQASGTTMITVSETTVFELIASGGGGEQRARATVAQAVAESEPNDRTQDATPLDTGSAAGSIDPAEDVDYYSFEVPAGGSVRAETFPAMAGCFDSELTLIGEVDGSTTALGANDDGDSGLCSLIDPTVEEFARNLEAGTYYIAVRRSPLVEDLTGDYVLLVEANAPACGNDIPEAGEGCEDGNTIAGDGCSATCQLEVATEIGGAGGSASLSVAANASAIVRITVSEDGQSISATTKDMSGACAVDTGLVLFDSAQNRLGLALGDGEGGECGVIRFPTDAFATNLVAGAYDLRVLNESGTNGTVELTVTIHDAGCGNGAIEGNEECDDGNRTPDDGCSRNCDIENLGTVTGPGPGSTFSGAISYPGKEDYYRVTMTARGYILAETGAPSLGTCTGGADTIIDLLDSMYRPLGSVDDIGGTNLCSRLNFNSTNPFNLVQRGTYYVRVRAFPAAATIPAYELEIHAVGLGCGNGIVEGNESCDDGNTIDGDGCSTSCAYEGMAVAEVEPNGTRGEATASGAAIGQTVILQAAISPVADLDYFSFTVPAGQTATLIARVHTAIGDPTSCANDTDTRIALYDSAGTVLARADDSGPTNYCSLMNGTTTSPGAANLAAGTYTIEVKQFDNSEEIPEYYLDITLQ